MIQVQVFGTRKCAETRKALRFFAERRIKTHFVDLKTKPASVGELRRFVQRFGVEALVDRTAKRFNDKGFGAAHFGEDRWLTILAEEPLILTTPLVRSGNRVVIGHDPEAFKEWVAG